MRTGFVDLIEWGVPNQGRAVIWKGLICLPIGSRKVGSYRVIEEYDPSTPPTPFLYTCLERRGLINVNICSREIILQHSFK